MIDQETQKIIDELKSRIELLEKRPLLQDHKHDGVDTYRISLKDLKNQPVVNIEVLTIGSENAGDYQDMFFVNSLSAAITIGAPVGSPKNGQKLVIRLEDNGTGRAITWNAIYVAMGVSLPTTTIANKTLYCGFIYNSNSSKWELVAKAEES